MKRRPQVQIQVIIDQAAKKKGVSLYALAKKLGVKPNALTVTKRPGYNPKLETLVTVSQALNCPITDLYKVTGKAQFNPTTAKAALTKVATSKTVKKTAKPAKKPAVKAKPKT